VNVRPHLPDSDPPFFFKRLYMGGTALDEVTQFKRHPDGTLEIIMGVPDLDVPYDPNAVRTDPLLAMEGGLMIFGRAVTTPNDPHDLAVIERNAQHGLVFCDCYSVAAPIGELGFHPIATLTEITRDEFDAAQRRGWQE